MTESLSAAELAPLLSRVFVLDNSGASGRVGDGPSFSSNRPP